MHWTPALKANVIALVKLGTREKAYILKRYDVGEEEFDEWVRKYDKWGVRGLRSTKTQAYRK